MLKSSFIREITLYRYRYGIGYAAFIVLLFALLLFSLNAAPRGLTDGEMQSAVTGVNINILAPTAQNVIDAPYHLMQKLSIQLFGLQPFSIKLPSIILGVITGIAMVIMLQRWFKRNVAVISAILIATSTGFISLSRLGEPLIMTTFWTVILLLASTFVLHSNRATLFWRIVCFVSVGLLLYSPLGIYPLIAMTIAGLLHPHVRHRIKQGKWWQFLLLGLAFSIAIAPLAIAIVNDPSVGMHLLGIDHLNFSPGYLFDSAKTIVSSLFNFNHSYDSPITFPLFGLVSAALLLLGFLKLCTASYSARSYMLFIWLGLLFVVLLFNPSAIAMVLAPATLIMAIGIETLIREWYGLFPRNPYARIGALVPLAVLLVSVVSTNIERYFYGNHYANTSHSLHAELPAIRTSLDRNDLNLNKTQLVVPQSQIAFYDILRREHRQLVVSDHINTKPEAKGTLLIAGNSQVALPKKLPYRIITNDLHDNNVLVRVYTKW